MRSILTALLAIVVTPVVADPGRVFPEGERPADARLGELRTLNSYVPFQNVESKEQWATRQADIKRRLLISQGLWPEPTKTPLNAVVHGRVEFEDYTVDRVFFESIPGHFVTGSLYRPKGKAGPFPAVLCPHGHWRDARFYDAGEANAKSYIAQGAERFINAGRNHIQARCVQLARMGCIAFFYDMTGNCDSIQLPHRPSQSDHLDTTDNWGFFGVQAELRLQNMMGLQTWNSVRSIDFLLDQPDVDGKRIGVTGASGGGTQSMIIAAVDDRITAAMPCVMVSTAMQGGCTCENAPLMRINQGNIDIAAAIAPRPLGLTAADDWTVELRTKGYPDLLNLYEMLGVKNRLTAVFHTHFPHNYNHVNRTVMYGFFNRHFGLGFKEPILESDFELLGKEQLTVWSAEHPAPTGTSIGDPHEISINRLAAEDSDERMQDLIPGSNGGLDKYREAVGGAWETILGRTIDQVGDVKFTETSRRSSENFETKLGRLDHSDSGEQIPALIVSPTNGPIKGTVIWITDSGKSGVFSGENLTKPVAKLIDEGFSILTADLSGQGEFLSDEKPRTAQRMWQQRGGSETWHRFAGYTYGFNHSLFVKRTHDILTLIKFAQSRADKSSVHLVGLGEISGPLVIAARSQATDLVARTVANLHNFQFRSLTKHSSPMFVPGAVKYLDIDGLLSFCAPHRVVVANATTTDVSKHVYSANGTAGNLTTISAAEIADALYFD